MPGGDRANFLARGWRNVREAGARRLAITALLLVAAVLLARLSWLLPVTDEAERNGDIDIERKARFDRNDGDEADGDPGQHVESKNTVRQGRPNDDAPDGQKQRQAEDDERGRRCGCDDGGGRNHRKASMILRSNPLAMPRFVASGSEQSSAWT